MHPLKQAIERHGYTVNGLAIKMGVSPQNLYN